MKKLSNGRLETAKTIVLAAIKRAEFNEDGTRKTYQKKLIRGNEVVSESRETYGAHVVYDGVNDALRAAGFNDPKSVIAQLEQAGVIWGHVARGGYRIYNAADRKPRTEKPARETKASARVADILKAAGISQ